MKQRRKRSTLPDLRPRRYSYLGKAGDAGRFVFPDSKIAQLAEKHGFPAQFNLPKHLEDPLLGWRADLTFGPPMPGAERKRLLRELAKRAKSFAEAARCAGDYERKLILEALAPAFQRATAAVRDNVRSQETPIPINIPSDRQWLAVEVAFDRLEAAAIAAQSKVRQSRAGARGRQDEINLICGLWRAYRTAFGAAARRISWDGSRYSGKFLDFADDVLRQCCAINLPNQALGRAIMKAHKAVDLKDGRSRR